jgi:hypothetical protein
MSSLSLLKGEEVIAALPTNVDAETMGGVKDAVVVTPSKRVSRKLRAELLVERSADIDIDDDVIVDDVVVVADDDIVVAVGAKSVVVRAKQSAGVTLLLSIQATIEMMVAPLTALLVRLLEEVILVLLLLFCNGIKATVIYERELCERLC